MQRGSPNSRIILLLLLLIPASALTQTAARPEINKPEITKIDPPNWWPALPDPMLLIYGRNLAGAHFAVQGTAVTILKTKTSGNGHYAFLWIATKDAHPQALHILASNATGAATGTFELRPRDPARKRYQGFSSADVMYLIMTDRFADGDPSNDQPGYAPDAPRGWHGGDFRGIDEHLDYLSQLGVTTLWLTPILSNGNMPDSYHGYAAVDLYAVDSHFGSLADYQHLARDLHGRGMKIVFDSVPNHIGVQHPWVHDPPTPDWFHGTLELHPHAQFNFEKLVDPHSPPADSFDITHGWFTDQMPDLNQENPLVARYLIQNATWWIETAGLDGLRIDTFPFVGRAFWGQFHQQLHSLYPNLTTVGEVFNGDPAITSFFAGGMSHEGIDTGLYTPFDFPMYFTVREVLLRGKPMSDLVRVMADDHLYPHPERLVPFFGNHDTRRFLSESGATPDNLKLAFALLTTMRGMPEIYSGDEVAMEGGDDPDNRRDFPGGFRESNHDAFTSAGRTEKEQDIFNWASSLIHLRESHEAISAGQQQDLFADATAIAYLRGNDLDKGCRGATGAERILVVISKASVPRSIDLETTKTGFADCAHFNPLFPAEAAPVRSQRGTISIAVNANGVAIYSVR